MNLLPKQSAAALGFALFAMGIVAACGDENPNEAQVNYRQGETWFDENTPESYSLVRFEQENENGERYFYCSGVLVHPRVVMTAAHCVVETDPFKQTVGKPFEPSKLHLRLSNGVKAQAQSLGYAPGYGFAYTHTDTLDIGYVLLATSQPAEIVAEVASEDDIMAWLKKSRMPTVSAAGFGQTGDSAATAGTLNGLKLPFLGFFGPKKDRQKLSVRESSAPKEEATVMEFIAGYDERNACNGDSGGGAFVTLNGKTKLFGITSRIIQTPSVELETCGFNSITTIYGIAHHYLPTLEAQTGLKIKAGSSWQ